MKIEDVKVGEDYRYVGGAADGGYPHRIGEVCTVTDSDLLLARFKGEPYGYKLAVYASELEPLTNEKEDGA